MVKVGILGADSPLAGEIIRILIKHPEVELISLYAPNLLGRAVSSIHHGLIGEPSLNFTDKVNTDEIDFAIILEDSPLSKTLIGLSPFPEDFKLVILPEVKLIGSKDKFEIGLSEINRKALVRGACAAYIPSSVSVPSLVALAPLANFLLLNSDIKIHVELPKDIYEKFDISCEANLIADQLQQRQSSFKGNIELSCSEIEGSNRASSTKITLQSSLSLEEIEKIYDDMYDDHNFVFLYNGDVDINEVEGTQKIIMKVSKPNSDTLLIEAVADARMRGGAGDVVHVLNLFFGLHEKTGLHLKASRY